MADAAALGRGRPSAAALAGGALVLHLALILPHHPGAMTWGALRLVPAELPALLLMLAALPGGRLAAVLAAAWLAPLTVWKIADLAMFAALGRPFDAVHDGPLVEAGLRLLAGTWGWPAAAAAAAAVPAAALLLAAVLWRAARVWTRLSLPAPLRAAAAVLGLAAGGLAAADAARTMRVLDLAFDPPGTAFSARLTAEKLRAIARSRADLSRFRAAAGTDIAAHLADPLGRLRGRDVLVIFVESYARASIEAPDHAPRIVAALRTAEPRLAAAGLSAVSLWLTSPIEGGQSWLAHATFAAGLPVDRQGLHAALLASPRRMLWQIARDAGWRTVAVAPAVTYPWPEAARLGFETVLDRAAMRYAGPPFSWVTMPDQFTLARFRDRLPPDPAGRPLFAQLALISSHAPWTPIPEALPWDEVGDGAAFAAMAARGPSPEEVWSDPARIRDHYGRALDYALSVALDFAAREGAARGAEAPLMLILGDHPPAPFVAGQPGRDVPLHVVGPAAAVAPLAAAGATPGLLPRRSTPVWPMQDVRDRFLLLYSGKAGASPP